jgi:hypothetical protein
MPVTSFLAVPHSSFLRLSSAFQWEQAICFGRFVVDSKLREMALCDSWIQLV